MRACSSTSTPPSTLAVAAIILAKQGPSVAAEPAATPAATRGPSSSRADVTVAHAAALKTGKPIYLLFHSLTCVPCVEISAVVDKVIPAYEERIVFVNAISDDEPSPRAC